MPGARNWILADSVRFLPRRTVTNVVRQLQERARMTGTGGRGSGRSRRAGAARPTSS